MPSRIVNLDTSGNGEIRFDRPLTTLTIINPSSTNSVQFQWSITGDFVTLAANVQVELEEEEAAEVEHIVFINGAANGTVTVTWSYRLEKVRLA